MKLSRPSRTTRDRLQPMTLRYAVQVVCAIVVTLTLGQLLQTQVQGATADGSTRRPNIVLIVADDLGYNELGSYGQRKILTPHLDRLAAEGMRFTQHYCGAPVCAPSRCVLMTGKHLGHAFIRNNREVRPEGQYPIPAAEVTIGELLKSAGYATAAIGKWGLGPVGSTGDPLKQGFDHFLGYNCQRHAHSYYPDYLWRDDKRISLDNNPPVPGHARLEPGDDPRDPRSYARFQGRDFAPDHMIEGALTFIREHRQGPFFLYFPSPIPHLALHIPDEDLKVYQGKWKEQPFTGGGYTPHLTPRAAYAAMITRMDKDVGRIMSLLKELNIDDDTLVMFSSDNGTTHLRKEVDYDFFNSVGELRGLKGSVYEGGIRVPFIARWPGKIKPQTATDHVSAFYDILPTLCDVAGVQAPDGIDGLSFLPALTGAIQPRHEFLVWEFYGYGGQQAVRWGDWKGVRTNCNRAPSGPLELYDLASDIGETKDVAQWNPEVVKRIEQIMKTEHSPSELFRFQPPKPKPRPKNPAKKKKSA